MTSVLGKTGRGALWRRPLRGAPLALLALSGLACGGPPPAQFPEGDDAIAALRRTTECSRAVQGEADLSFSGEGRRLRGKILYLAAAPDRIRFDVFSPFGVTLSTLTSDGENFTLYNLEERSFVYGNASTCNVERFTRVPVPPSVLVELLRGRPPVLSHSSDSASLGFVRRPLARGYYQVEIVAEHEAVQTLNIAVHPDDWEKPPGEQRLRLLGVEVRQAGQLLYSVELSDYRTVQRVEATPDPEALEMGIIPRAPSGPECSAELPGKIQFYVPETGHELVFDNRELSHNPGLSESTFSQVVPGGVLAQESRCVDR